MILKICNGINKYMFYKRRTHIKAGPTGRGVVVYVKRAEWRPWSLGHALTGRKGVFCQISSTI